MTMQLPLLSVEEEQRLLLGARQSIVAALCGLPPFEIPQAELTKGLCSPHAAFVTLKRQGELRGCIGKMDYCRPLWENVIEAAVAAALEDPRFPAVSADELPKLHVEISVLSVPEVLARVEEFDPLRHGIIIEKAGRHALLLPKVAQEYGWDARQVLEALCNKAGLSSNAWRESDAKLQVFTALDFAEPTDS